MEYLTAGLVMLGVLVLFEAGLIAGGVALKRRGYRAAGPLLIVLGVLLLLPVVAVFLTGVAAGFHHISGTQQLIVE